MSQTSCPKRPCFEHTGAGDAANPGNELQALGLAFSWTKQAFEASAQAGRDADVRLGSFVLAIEGEDRLARRKLPQSLFGMAGIERQALSQ